MFALSLDEFALAVVCHVLDKLSNPAMEVFLTGNELAIYQFLVRDLYLFITGVNGWLFMGKATLGFLLGTNPIRMVGLYMTWGLSFSSR